MSTFTSDNNTRHVAVCSDCEDEWYVVFIDGVKRGTFDCPSISDILNLLAAENAVTPSNTENKKMVDLDQYTISNEWLENMRCNSFTRFQELMPELQQNMRLEGQ